MSTTATKIAWTDRTWNPLRGCSRVSSGCDHCYAAAVAHRFDKPGLPYEGLSRKGPHGPDWSGKVVLVEKALLEPLSWRKPVRVFVNSMSDLFHPAVQDETIAAIFGVMAACPHLTFQVLTKRPERMREWFTWIACNPVSCGGAANAARGVRWYAWHHIDDLRVHDPAQPWVWPLPNVWIGVSVEDQTTADERISLLLQTPAAVRFISAEPLLGPIDLEAVPLPAPGADVYGLRGVAQPLTEKDREPDDWKYWTRRSAKLGWVIVGGESGPKARPCDVAWIRSIVQQCAAADVACFVKQLGARPESVRDHISYRGTTTKLPDGFYRHMGDSKGADPAEWPEDLRVQQFPRVQVPREASVESVTGSVS